MSSLIIKVFFCLLIGAAALEGVGLLSGVTSVVSHKPGDRMSMSHKNCHPDATEFVSYHL